MSSSDPDSAKTSAVKLGGRNLPVAIATGVALLALVLATVLIRKDVLVAVAVIAVGIGVIELAAAMRGQGIQLPLPPLLVGTVAIMWSAYRLGPEGLLFAYGMTAAVVVAWRVLDSRDGAFRDCVAAVFAATYLPFLAGFVMLILAHPDGAHRLILFIFLPVASDTGGFFIGSWLGRHPMLPAVSPKKSWEGFAGSLGLTLIIALILAGPLTGASIPVAILLAVAVTVAATLGDFAESLIKRDLAVKDMGSVLPGHGGLLDRLDSLLVTAPVLYVLMGLFVPGGF
jgi:phosphatidate cytidylyltransferase